MLHSEHGDVQDGDDESARMLHSLKNPILLNDPPFSIFFVSQRLCRYCTIFSVGADLSAALSRTSKHSNGDENAAQIKTFLRAARRIREVYPLAACVQFGRMCADAISRVVCANEMALVVDGLR